MEFGKVTKMTNEKYHSKEMQGFISKGDLDLINKAPYIYKDKLDGKYKVEVTDAMALGSFFHTLVLEPELAVNYISDKKAVAYGSRATKAYKEALKNDDFITVSQCIENDLTNSKNASISVSTDELSLIFGKISTSELSSYLLNPYKIEKIIFIKQKKKR